MTAEPLALDNASRSRSDDLPTLYDPATQRRRDPAAPAAQAPRTGEKTVLVFTRRFDPHADVVIDAVERAGGSILRINSENLMGYRMSWNDDSAGIILSDNFGRVADIATVSACYLRRPLPPLCHPDSGTDAAEAFSAAEAAAMLRTLYAHPDVRWVSPPQAVDAAESKLVQLAVAKRVGLAVPPTLITNDPQDAVRFAAEVSGDLVIKPLRTASLDVGADRLEISARRWTPTQIRGAADAVRLAPTLLQQYVPKVAEVRVTVIGDKAFPVRLRPTADDIEIDWSRIDNSVMSYQPIALPDDLLRRIHRFVGWYGLKFSALDFLITEAGELLFLENNPTGAWYWLELATGLPLADTMAQLLLARNRGVTRP